MIIYWVKAPFFTIEENDIKKYRKILGKEKYGEFGRAVGLYTHGIGIGSYVYLRRIFENLIEEAHQTKSLSEK